MRRRPFLAVAAGLVLLAGLEGSASPAPPAGFLGDYRWDISDPLFGGWSGLRLSPDGSRLTALSDHGAFIQGRIKRDTKGKIIGITAGAIQPLKGTSQAPLAAGRTDSEGLEIAPDGTAYISFEGVARVLKYRKLGGIAENLPSHPDFATMQINSSLEALAMDASGALYTLPERSGRLDRPFPVYRFRAGKWDKTLSIRRDDSYLPVDADFGPDGKFYLLERQFRGLSGFSTRLRRFDLTAKGFVNETLLLQTPVGLYDNLEGLSIWRNASGDLTATMISDDNFAFFLKTEIVEYRLPD